MSDREALTVRLLLPEEPLPWDLLLEADPSRSHVESSLKNATVVVATTETIVCGVLVLHGEVGGPGEILNIAVHPSFRQSGVGKQLVHHAIGLCRSRGLAQLEVSTGNSSLGQLAFYQKTGFRIVGVEPDYFTRNYPETIVENGIVCRDRVVLNMDLAPPTGG